MADKNIQRIQLIRNGVVNIDRAAAISGIEKYVEDHKTDKLDGVVVLGRYNDNGQKTLVGYVQGSNQVYNTSILDIDKTNSDIESIQEELEVITSGGTGSIASQIANAINALDYTDVAVENSYVSAVNQLDGKITATTKVELPVIGVDDTSVENQFLTSIKLDGRKVKSTRSGINSKQITRTANEGSVSASTVEGAITELKGDIASLTNSSRVTVESGGTTDAYAKTYTIKQGGSQVGLIEIPKDLVVSSGAVVKGTWKNGDFTEDTKGLDTALKLVIANKENTPLFINTVDLVKDHTGASGITISNTNVISAVKDSTSEDFLTIGENGIKVSGVSSAIDAAKNSIVGESGDTSSALTINGLSKAIKEEAATARSAEKANADAITKLNGDASIDGSVKKAVNDLKVSLIGDAASDYDTLGKLEDKIQDVDEKASKAHTEVNPKTNGHVFVSVADSADKTHKVVTVTEGDIASDTALANEIDYRKAVDGINGDAYVPNTASTYISAATSLNDADVKIDSQVKDNADAIEKNKVVAGNGISATVDTNTTVAVKLATDSGLSVDASGLTIDLSSFTLDCGTY